MTKPCAVASISLLSLLATASCTSTSAQPGNGSAAGAAGSATGVGGAAGAGMIGGPSGLPVPPGPGGVPPPTGTPGNLHVLDWAGWKAAVTYTFDDAQPSQIEHYAELQATGAHFTFYITSGNSGVIGGFDSTFAQAVTDGHEMGNHTVHHCHADLSGCSTGAATSLDTELDDCNSYIATHFGQSQIWTAASPYGDTGYDTPDRTRFFLNRGVGSGLVAPVDNTDPFNLPCHAAVASETVDSFNTAIDGGRDRRPLADLPGAHDHADDGELVRADRHLGGHRQRRARADAGRRLDRHHGQRRRVLARAEGPRHRDARHRKRRPDLDLDAARELPARQVRAGHRRRGHGLAERHERAVGQPRLLRDRARRRVADLSP